MQRQRITILSLMLLAIFAAPFAVSIARAQSRSVAVRLPNPRELARYGLDRMWWGQATINPSRDTIRHLVADEESVFVQSTAGVLTAFDAESGRKMWAVQLGRSDQISYPAVTNNDSVLVAVGMRLYSLTRNTGERLWEIQLDRHPSTSPTVDENNVYIGEIDGSVYAYDLRKIRELYNENLLPQWSNVALKWRFRATQEITSAPVTNGRVLSFASRDRSLYTVTCDERQVISQFETDYPASAPLAMHGDSIILVAGDHNVYNININNGRMKWRFVTGSLVDERPHVIGDKLYLVSEFGGLYCIDIATGKLMWNNPRLSSFIAASENKMYATDELNHVLTVSMDTGIVLDDLHLEQFPLHFSNGRTDRMFLATESGLIVALKEIGNDFPIYHQRPDDRPLLPDMATENEETPAGSENDGENNQ